MLWISQPFGLGRIYPLAGLWIRGGDVGSGERGQMMQGDIAPCGTTHRDAAVPRLLTHALRE